MSCSTATPRNVRARATHCGRHSKNTSYPALCPGRVADRRVPLAGPLPSAGSAVCPRRCSPASSVLWVRSTPQRRTCRATTLRSSPTGPGHLAEGVAGVSRFSHMEFPRMLRVSDSAAPKSNLRFCRCPSCGLPPVRTRSARRSGDFGAQWLACVHPCLLLHPRPHGRRRQTRGQDGALLLSCAALSSATPCRFIPALSPAPFSTPLSAQPARHRWPKEPATDRLHLNTHATLSTLRHRMSSEGSHDRGRVPEPGAQLP